MKKEMKRDFGLVVLLAVMGLFSVNAWASGFSDSFEDGSIDPSLWVTHGYKMGVGGIGSGSWNYSFAEVIDTDGYLKARVWGPTSGNTYGAEARVRTSKNFNDGNPWLINFSWSTAVHPSPHCDVFAIQISDGNTPDINSWPWPWGAMPTGTVNLWRTSKDATPDTSLLDKPWAPFSKTDWSVIIDPAGTASLYQSPDGNGALFRAVSLDLSKGWYLQFIVNDATSAGYTAGDASFNLYEFSAIPEPTTLSLLVLAGIPFISRRRRV